MDHVTAANCKDIHVQYLQLQVNLQNLLCFFSLRSGISFEFQLINLSYVSPWTTLHHPCQLTTLHHPWQLTTLHHPCQLTTLHHRWPLTTLHHRWNLTTLHNRWPLTTLPLRMSPRYNYPLNTRTRPQFPALRQHNFSSLLRALFQRSLSSPPPSTSSGFPQFAISQHVFSVPSVPHLPARLQGSLSSSPPSTYSMSPQFPTSQHVFSAPAVSLHPTQGQLHLPGLIPRPLLSFHIADCPIVALSFC